jgi:hypothetical protein
MRGTLVTSINQRDANVYIMAGERTPALANARFENPLLRVN